MSIQLMQQAICYMEEHICENISYAEVAKSVHMSSYNFHRTFSFITGMTANEYIRNRRLTLAATELQTTDIAVIDVAYKYGYESPESFSKAFSRFHGVTPRQAKQKGTKLRLFNPLVIKIILEGGNVMDYRIEHRESQRFLALVKAFPNESINDDNDHSIPDFWTECFDKDLIGPMKSCVWKAKEICMACAARSWTVIIISIMESVLWSMKTRTAPDWNNFSITVIPSGKQHPPIMRCLNVLVLMEIVWVKPGVSFTKSLFRRQAIRRQTIPTLKFILKMGRVACSVSCGCQ